MPAPVASSWSGRREGLAPAGKRRLVTAHVVSGPRTISALMARGITDGHFRVFRCLARAGPVPTKPDSEAASHATESMAMIADGSPDRPVRRFNAICSVAHTGRGGARAQSLSTTDRSIRPTVPGYGRNVPIAWGVTGRRQIRDDHRNGYGGARFGECYGRGV